ncbi:sensor histidine kinase [Nocardioides seonyuensis]|uniref:Sensor histidine kinase n=1 Tax=Nocardioides seonyuensis TaxID=2518371 RepID=A0A4P7IEK9_9ACTN|nr:sensor histidine kinase [Nocardioides seonyuensis]QBX55675.1 sensor histidine kinase [Nocardioides seonyuensis]
MTPEPLPVNPWQKWGWAFASIWLVFLVYPVTTALEADGPAATRVFALACILAFAVFNILGYGPLQGRAWLAVAGMVLAGAATIPVIGMGAVAYTPYLVMLSALQLPPPWWKWATAAWAAVPLVALLDVGGFPSFFFLTVWPIAIGGVLLRIFAEKEYEFGVTKERLALVAERERVARDVHDVLGHSLTALSIKAELASRLIEVDPARAKAELESIQETARLALAEVRSTVGGLRAANLEAELAAAPQVLADAGIATEVHGEVSDTDPRHRALLAWVLRESVTNVVRHSGAHRVGIVLAPTGLVVSDDGRGLAGPEGNGLRGMRERVSAAGGRVVVSGADPGTRLEVVL